MPNKCGLIAAQLPPEVWLEGASNAVRIHLECSKNVPGMAAEYGLNVQEFKQNAALILRMSRVYQECHRNVPW